MYYPFEIQVTPLTAIRRERVLPAPGVIKTRIGEHVEPMQVVARTELPGNFRLLPVAHLLGVSSSKVKRFLRVKAGDEVREGQVVAAKRGLAGRSIKSPIDGTITASGSGRVLIEAPPTLFELRAYVPGTVSNVLKEYGVVVETMGAIVQGVWGTGGENFGVLKCLSRRPDKPLRARIIDPSCHGTIMVGGSGLDEEVLERAKELQVRGIVTGGFPPELISQVKNLPFPIVVTEGIGAIAMSTPIFELLKTHDGREASISGETRMRWGTLHPEIIIPLPADSAPSTQKQPGAPMTVGSRVRVTREPHAGQVGTATALPPHPRRIETGARVHGAEVDLDDADKSVFVPLVNLEVLR